MSTIKGQCVCGRYRIEMPKPQGMNLCHCVDCRRWAGSMYSAHLMSDAKDVKFEGPEPKTFTVKGIDGRAMTRAWCDGCGSGLWIRPNDDPAMTKYKAGLFEPGSLCAPTSEVFTKDMESWEKPQETAKQYERNLDF